MKPLVIEEEVEPELAGSVAFYEQRQSGLGLEFERATREALRKMADAIAVTDLDHESLRR